jgi:hypothetical protein
MQYNACTQWDNGSPSVQPEWSQSVIFLFFIFFSIATKSVGMYGTRMSRMDTSFSFFLSVCNECHGWTDSFKLFQFSFSSVAYSQVSLSTEVPTKKKKKKKKKKNTDKHTETQIRSEVPLNVTDGTIQEQTCRTNITFSQHMQSQCTQCNTMQCNAIQCNAMQCNAMYVLKSVRPYGMKSVSHFLFFLFF